MLWVKTWSKYFVKLELYVLSLHVNIQTLSFFYHSKGQKINENSYCINFVPEQQLLLISSLEKQLACHICHCQNLICNQDEKVNLHSPSISLRSFADILRLCRCSLMTLVHCSKLSIIVQGFDMSTAITINTFLILLGVITYFKSSL